MPHHEGKYTGRSQLKEVAERVLSKGLPESVWTKMRRSLRKLRHKIRKGKLKGDGPTYQ